MSAENASEGATADAAERLENALADREERLRSLDAQLAAALSRLSAIEPIVASRRVRLVLRAGHTVDALVARAAPPATRRAKGLGRAGHMLSLLADEGVGATIRYARDRNARLNPAKVSPHTGEDEQYRRWLADHEPTALDLEAMRTANRGWAYRPLVSIVVPVYNPRREWLDAMVESVLSQTYENWELCLADDLSPAPHVRPALLRWAERDSRVKAVFREKNGNIAAASNSALALAGGEFVALLDHDDVLRPHALHRVVEVLQDDSEADLVYSDEDKILVGGARGQVNFKGEFDPDYLLSTNYLCHLSVLRRELVTEVGGFRLGLDGSQDHDLLLRVSERARLVRHIPDVLYSWKQVPGSAALDFSEKPAAWEAGRRAVEDALARVDAETRAEFGPLAGTYVARYPVPEGTSVTAIVMARDAQTTARSLQALQRASERGPGRWIIVGYDPALQSLRRRDVEVVLTHGSAHHPRLLNELVSRVESEVVVFVAGDVAPAPGLPGWLGPLLEQALRSGVGVAGGRIAGVDGSPEQEGLNIGGRLLVESSGIRWPVIQRVAAVSADCLAIRREHLVTAGGFDESYRLCLFDIDLCLRLRRNHLATVYTPLTELQRLRPRVATAPAADDAREFRARWEGTPEWNNPYVSPWLERVTPLVIRGV